MTTKVLVWQSLDGTTIGYKPAKFQFQEGANILLKDGRKAKCLACVDLDNDEVATFKAIFSIASKRFKKTARPSMVVASMQSEVGKLLQVGNNDYLNMFLPIYKQEIF